MAAPPLKSKRRGASSDNPDLIERRQWYDEMMKLGQKNFTMPEEVYAVKVKKAIRQADEAEAKAKAAEKEAAEKKHSYYGGEGNDGTESEGKKNPFNINMEFKSTSLSVAEESLARVNAKPAEEVYEIPEYTRDPNFNPKLWFVKLNKVDIRKNSGKPILVVFPGVSASPTHFKFLATQVEMHEIPAIGVCLPGRMHRFDEEPLRCVYQSTGNIVDAIKEGDFLSDDPEIITEFVFFGHSVGALIAFEVARELSLIVNVRITKLVFSVCRSPSILTDFNKDRFGTKFFCSPDRDIMERLQKLRGVPLFMETRKDLMKLYQRCRNERTR